MTLISSPLRDVRLTARVGRVLGIAVAVCFVTGLLSHLHQHPVGWLPLPPGPAWGYRFTQGLHVACGLVCIPLVLVKLFSVYPRLFEQPAVRSLAHGLERAAIAVLVAAMLFELASGVSNVAQWYPFGFYFPAAHYAVAWALVGSLLVHLAVKAPVIVEALRDRLSGGDESSLTRRGLLVATAASAATLTAVTAGQTVPGLSRLTLLAPRRPDVGSQGLPVNKTARAGQVLTLAVAPDWALSVDGPTPLRLTLDDLAGLPQHERDLSIACVEGWSASASWGGVLLSELLARSGVSRSQGVRLTSLQPAGLYRSSDMTAAEAWHPDALVALRLRGEPLNLDHGFPARLIAPNRPGVLQTKWLSRIEAA